MKVAIIKKDEESYWQSCKSITRNLLSAYEGLSDIASIKTFHLDKSSLPIDVEEVAQSILGFKPDKIVFIDHVPHPGELVSALAELHWNKAPTLIFHIFGDYILQSRQWFASSESLSQFPVQFICASHKQRELLNKTLIKKAESLCPFPVDGNDFFFDQEGRQAKRRELGIEGEFIFLYTGRLSYQKNIMDLIVHFKNYWQQIDSQAKLIFAGPMDDLGIPYLGKEGLPGTFFFHWQEALGRNTPKELLDNIIYLGNLKGADLRNLYQAADYYISPSCHNDEDYGMSPAEALMCGLNCILSDWGGFSSFKEYVPEGVCLVPVEFERGKNTISGGALFKEMLKNGVKQFSKEERQKVSKMAFDNLNIETVRDSLKEILNNKTPMFEGFSENLMKLDALFSTNAKAPFLSPGNGYSQFYYELYRHYGLPLAKEGKSE